MNVYENLNKITEYIEENLDNDIDYNIIARFMGVNTYTMQRVFSLLTDTTLSEYIRKRRLSAAAYDLYKGEKVIDTAIKYGYNNATSFSRAFLAFHGIKPSKVKNLANLKNFPRIVFNVDVAITSSMEYKIVYQDELTLYGFSTKTNNTSIKNDAPSLFEKISLDYADKFGSPNYAIITYDLERENCTSYWVLYDKKISVKNIKKIVIPKSKFLLFRIYSQDAKDIQVMSNKFYKDFLPSCNYNLKPIPELEHYHDGITDFLVPIY